jgi:hypothetical protein
MDRRTLTVFGWNQSSKKYKVLLQDEDGELIKCTASILKDRDYCKWVDEEEAVEVPNIFD